MSDDRTRGKSRHHEQHPATLILGAGRSSARKSIRMGKSLQPLNAIAVRPPTNTPAASNSAGTGATQEPATAESLGWQLRAALPPLRLHSVSLYDEEANVLWLSEGALGPDEHGLVIEATETLRRDTSQSCYENGLEDGRVALFLPVRAPQGALVGLVMVLADIKSVGDGVLERMVTPQIRTIMQKVAVLLRPLAARSSHTEAALPILELASETAVVAVLQTASAPPAASAPTVAPPSPVASASPIASAPPLAPVVSEATVGETAPVLSPQAVEDILEFELTPDLPQAEVRRPAPAVNASSAQDKQPASTTALSSHATTGTAKVLAVTGTSRTLALPEGLTLSLDVQPFTKLRAGGRTRRYEVRASAVHRDMQRVPPGLDSYALQHLLAWLAANRSVWNSEPTSFTLNLSINTLEDERFPQFVASNLKTHGIAPDNIGFEIAEPLCLQRRAQVERFITLCDKLGCFVVIDDFSLDSSVVGLLRSKALRLVKIDAKLTSVALKDKLSQALVVAIAQAVKVLGIHCAAKRVESQAALQWLTAIGCDFAQGAALSAPQPLESLLIAPQSVDPGKSVR
ncbi:MAG: EAL domain-containing protein [Steroidobacteraceae bacterium]